MTPLRLLGRAHGRLVHGPRTIRIARALLPLIPEGKILDVGSGDGRIGSLLMEKNDAVQVEGIDISVRKDSLIPVREFDGRRIPFDDDSFDAALLIDVLHHADDPCGLLRECGRVSKRRVIIKDHVCHNSVEMAILSFMDWVGNRPHGVALTCRYFDSAGWDECIEAATLKRVREDSFLALYPFPFSLLFGRKMHVILSLAGKHTDEQRTIERP